jgi:hypothetical protein
MCPLHSAQYTLDEHIVESAREIRQLKRIIADQDDENTRLRQLLAAAQDGPQASDDTRRHKRARVDEDNIASIDESPSIVIDLEVGESPEPVNDAITEVDEVVDDGPDVEIVEVIDVDALPTVESFRLSWMADTHDAQLQ